MQIAMLQAQIQETQAKAQAQQANAQKTVVETQLAPEETKARVVAALSTNLNEDAEQKDFEKRVRLADLMLKEEDVRSNERIAFAQMQRKGNA